MTTTSRFPLRPPDEARVMLAGEFDLVTATSLVRDLLQVDYRSPTVVADLRNVTFMDSSGLRGLLLVQQTLAAEGSELRLANLPHQVETLLDITLTREVFAYTD